MMKLIKGQPIDQKLEAMGLYAHFAGIVSFSPHSNVCGSMSNSELVS